MIKISDQIPTFTVLLADHDSISATVLSTILSNAGYQVKSVKKGVEVLEVAKNCSPDLVLLDISMPDMDGFEIYRQLKRDSGTDTFPVLFVTERDDKADIVKGFELGIVDYITKPYVPEILLARIRSQLLIQVNKRKLQEQKEFVDMIYTSAGSAMLTNDLQGVIRSANDAAGRLFGYPSDQLIGQHMSRLIPQPLLRFFEHILASISAGAIKRDIAPREAKCIHRNGSLIDIEVVFSAIKLGNETLVINVINDISERKRIEQTVRQKSELSELIHRVTAAINMAENADSALRSCIDEICNYTHWPVATVFYQSPRNADVLIHSGIWKLSDAQADQKAIDYVSGLEIRAGDGFTGRILATAKAAWLENAEKLLGSQWNISLGIKAVIGIPILTGSRVAAVLLFATTTDEARDEALFEVIKDIGLQLGRVFERQQAEESFKKDAELFQLLHSASAGANMAIELDDAIEQCLESVCRYKHWEFGHCLVLSPDMPNTLISSKIWYLEDPAARNSALYRVVSNVKVPINEGMAGSILASGIPIWDTNYGQNESAIFQAKLFDDLGIQTNIGVPVIAGEQVLAVIWFASTELEEEDEQFSQALVNIGTHLGRVMERKQTEDHINNLANYDALTGLPSLRLGRDRLTQALAGRGQLKAALLYIDLDGFKEVNDTHGHDTGDFVLKYVAKAFQGCLRDSDTVSRVGGDEFLIILPKAGREQAATVAEKILRVINQPIRWQNHDLKLGASIGIALAPEHGRAETELRKRADEAMYIIKRQGKNNFGIAI